MKTHSSNPGTPQRRTPLPGQEIGLVAWLESERVRLPLKSVGVEFDVRGCIAEVQVRQVFLQEFSKPVMCLYQFPLPADAAVFGCQVQVGDRLLVAEVREREEAVRLAREQSAAGHRTMLVEAERANFFTLELGNLQPQDLVIVTLSYIQPVRRLGPMACLEVPLSPGERFVPGNALLRSPRGRGTACDTDQVPDASRVSPPRISAEHPEVCMLDITGRLDASEAVTDSLHSQSHGIFKSRLGDDLVVELVRGDEVPDADFVLRWTRTEPTSKGLRAWVCERDDAQYALVELRTLQSGKPLARREPTDTYFLLDGSGSMQGIKWMKAVAAVATALRELHSGDRANLCIFHDSARNFSEAPMSPAAILRDPQFQGLAANHPGGGTNLFPAMESVLAQVAEHSVGRRASIVLVTDGQFANEMHILQMALKRGCPPVHAFGIDYQTNDQLLVSLATETGGTFHSLRPEDDIPRIVSSVAGVFGPPALKAIRAGAGWELSPGADADLHASQVRYVSARRLSGATEPLEIRAQGPDGSPVELVLDSRTVGNPAPFLWWHQQHMNRACARNDKAGAVAHSLKSNLICVYTAFVAWDVAERVAIARSTFIQPSVEDTCSLHMVAKLTRFSAKRVVGMREMSPPLMTPMVLAIEELTAEEVLLTRRMADLLSKLAQQLGRSGIVPDKLNEELLLCVRSGQASNERKESLHVLQQWVHELERLLSDFQSRNRDNPSCSDVSSPAHRTELLWIDDAVGSLWSRLLGGSTEQALALHCDLYLKVKKIVGSIPSGKPAKPTPAAP